jgi:hypothetical protein
LLHKRGGEGGKEGGGEGGGTEGGRGGRGCIVLVLQHTVTGRGAV